MNTRELEIVKSIVNGDKTVSVKEAAMILQELRK